MPEITVNRRSNETDISLVLNIYGQGKYQINSGCGFFDHMLELFAAHGRFDLTLSCVGDTQVDYHHSIEDIGICLGRAFSQSLGDRAGINRYGSMILPMDEALVLSAVDISGRDFCRVDLQFSSAKIGDFNVELIEEFWMAFARQLGISIHISQMAGINNHHIAEAVFKGMGRALRIAVAKDESLCGQIPSTKGTIL